MRPVDQATSALGFGMEEARGTFHAFVRAVLARLQPEELGGSYKPVQADARFDVVCSCSKEEHKRPAIAAFQQAWVAHSQPNRLKRILG